MDIRSERGSRNNAGIFRFEIGERCPAVRVLRGLMSWCSWFQLHFSKKKNKKEVRHIAVIPNSSSLDHLLDVRMKLTSFLLLATASLALASPAAVSVHNTIATLSGDTYSCNAQQVSLERKTKLVKRDVGNEVVSCIQCPCDSWEPSSCRCVSIA